MSRGNRKGQTQKQKTAEKGSLKKSTEHESKRKLELEKEQKATKGESQLKTNPPESKATGKQSHQRT